MTSATVYAGVDVSKADLDLAFSDSEETVWFPNSEDGIGELVQTLEAEPPALVVLEATGGFETATALALAAREIRVVVVDPVRSAVYLSVWSASKWNPVIRVFYQRLRARGKPPKVAQVACMRKLLTILNAILRDGRRWDPEIPLQQLQLQHSCQRIGILLRDQLADAGSRGASRVTQDPLRFPRQQQFHVGLRPPMALH